MRLKRHKIHTYIEQGCSLIDAYMEAVGIEEAERDRFLHPDSHRLNTDFFTNLDTAVNFVRNLMRQNKRIMLYSDYDCDGTTGAAIMLRCFKKLGYTNVDIMIPSRFEEGYGLNPDSIEEMKEMGVDAVITIDLGIKDFEAVRRAKDSGIQVLVTDHHNLPDELPDADVILNPKMDSETSPHYNLCGAGVAYYLALNLLDSNDAEELTQLAAVATVADLVLLTGDNRTIVKYGLSLMREKPIPPIRALAELSNINISELNEEDIGFKIGPRINCAGRLGDAKVALKLLLADELEEAKTGAAELDKMNTLRKKIENDILDEALSLLDDKNAVTDSKINVVWGEDWHEGVIGIVASRLCDRYSKPAVVMSSSNSVLKASCRGVRGFSIYEAINYAGSHLIKYGGHEMACGFSLEDSKLDDFLHELNTYMEKNDFNPEEAAEIDVLTELSVPMISFESLADIKTLRPFGLGNPAPVFRTRDFKVFSSRIVGANSNVMKLQLEKNGRVIPAVVFKISDFSGELRDLRADAVYKLQENNFRDISSIELNIEDIRFYHPEFGPMQKLAFILFLLSLDRRILNSDGDFTLLSFREIPETELFSEHTLDKKIGINSYEALLEYMFMLFDRGTAFSDMLKESGDWKERISILPSFNNEADYQFKGGLFGTSDKGRQGLYKKMLTSGMHFNRAVFSRVYKDLKDLKKVNIVDYLFENDEPVSSVMAISFFEEAGFITKEGREICFNVENHNKTDFDTSKTYSSYRNFLLNL